MIVLTIQGREYEIYENEQEFEGSGKPKTTIERAVPEAYLRSSEGYWVPVLAVRGEGKSRFIYLPRKQIKGTQRSFSYGIRKYNAERYRLSPQSRLLAQMVAEGCDMLKAVKHCYPTFRGKARIILVRQLANEEFKRYLFVELGYMNKLKEALAERNITEDTFADKVEEHFNNASSKHHRWALDTVATVLMTKEEKVPTGGAVNAAFTTLPKHNSKAELEERMRVKLLAEPTIQENNSDSP